MQRLKKLNARLFRRHILGALGSVIVIRARDRPELGHFAAAQMVEIANLDIDFFAPRTKIRCVNKAQSELVIFSGDILNVMAFALVCLSQAR